jgi:putative ABC transport system permease protein
MAYAWRNLLRQPGRFVQVTGGIALVVVIVAFAAAFSAGMQQSLAASGDPQNVIILGTGSEESVERSQIPAVVAGVVGKSLGGLATVGGQPAVSAEVYYNGEVVVDGHVAQALLRGVTWQALGVHQRVRLIAGRFPGPDEIMVGRQVAQWLGVPETALVLGRTIEFEGRPYRISGHFVAPQTVQEAEVWMNLSDLMTATQRQTLSSVVLRRDTASFGAIDLFAASRLDLEITALPEDVYYAQLGEFFRPIRIITWITALLLVFAALFGGVHTMYAAIASRVKELATLQALGYRRWMLAISLLQEAVVIGVLGSLLGAAVAVVFLEGRTFALSTGVFALAVTPSILLGSLGLGVMLAIGGTAPPAMRCLFPSLAQTLRAS